MVQTLNLTERESWRSENAGDIVRQLKGIEDTPEYRQALQIFIDRDLPTMKILDHVIGFAERAIREIMEDLEKESQAK